MPTVISIEGVALNWTVDGVDATFDLRTSDGLWAPTTLGGHVIRANADGVFGLVRLTVEPGAASMLDLKEALPDRMVAVCPSNSILTGLTCTETWVLPSTSART